MENQTRCSWVNLNNETYIKYHDEEWGRPLYDDRKLYELLLLESFQAGLSWECVLNKRENFRAAFDSFDIDKVIRYDEKKKQELMNNPGIIRNRLKIKAAVNNSMVFKAIQKEYGSFSNYIWSFTDHRVIWEEFTERTTSPLSDTISRDLKKRGMTFAGSTIIYSFLQSMGVIHGHSRDCMCYQQKNMELVPAYAHKSEVRLLFSEYTAMLIERDPDVKQYLELQNYEEELEHLENKYGLPSGRLYLAYCDGEPAGCIGLRKIDALNCEMKRLYVRPQYRGRQIGDSLVTHIIEEAKKIGYTCMLLDTLPFLKSAIQLYKKYGFYEISSYNDSPMNTSIYMKLDL